MWLFLFILNAKRAYCVMVKWNVKNNIVKRNIHRIYYKCEGSCGSLQSSYIYFFSLNDAIYILSLSMMDVKLLTSRSFKQRSVDIFFLRCGAGSTQSVTLAVHRTGRGLLTIVSTGRKLLYYTQLYIHHNGNDRTKVRKYDHINCHTLVLFSSSRMKS